MAFANVPPTPTSIPAGTWYAYLYFGGAAIADWENPVTGPRQLYIIGTPDAGAYIYWSASPLDDTSSVSPHF